MSPREYKHPWLRNPPTVQDEALQIQSESIRKKKKEKGESTVGIYVIYLSDSKRTPSQKSPQIWNDPGAFTYPIYQQRWKHICIS